MRQENAGKMRGIRNWELDFWGGDEVGRKLKKVKKWRGVLTSGEKCYNFAVCKRKSERNAKSPTS